MKNNKYLYSIVLMMFLFISTLSKAKENQEYKFNYREDFVISEKTGGSIYPDEMIIVKFKDTQVSKEKFNKKIKNRVFSFYPSIAGEAYWEDGKTLVFKPKKELEMGRDYSGYLSLETLFKGEPNFKRKKINLDFYVYRREIQRVDAGFNYLDPADKKDYVFEGTLYFNYKTDLKSVKKAIEYKFKNEKTSNDFKKEKLEIFETGDNKIFKFKSKVVQKDKYNKECILEISSKPLNLFRNIKKSYKLYSAGYLYINNISEVNINGERGIEVRFSQELIKNGNYKGFIKIKPFLTAKFKVKGNKIVINGDFKPGEQYSVIIKEGLRSRDGYIFNSADALSDEYVKTIVMKDIEPKIEFSSDGIFLPVTNKGKIRFKTVNIKKVHLRIKRIYKENVNSFLYSTGYFGAKDRQISNKTRVGKVIIDKEITIGNTKNKWLQSEIDMKQLFDKNKKGMYVIELDYGIDDVLYNFPESWSMYKTKQYIMENGKVEKPLIISNIGIIAKEERKDLDVYVVNVINTSTLSGVKVYLKDYKNKVLRSATTDQNGKVIFRNYNKNKTSFIEVEGKTQVAMLKLSSDKLSNSILNTDGVNPYNLDMRAFIYTERGVYRPGDEINISAILRNKNNTFPSNYPVIFRIYNPKNTKTLEYVSKKGTDGFYNYTFKSSLNDLTGDWRVDVEAGSNIFSQQIKIETVVPYKLKLKIENKTKEALTVNKNLDLNINTKYLFGTPAKRHKIEADIELVPFEKKFKNYSDYIFIDKSMTFNTLKSVTFKGESDAEGNFKAKWNIPELDAVPSGLKAVVNARALEKGGRPVPESKTFKVDFYDKYVGIKPIKTENYKLGTPVKMKAVLLDKDGKPIKGEILNYKIYYNRQFWWWDYDNINEFKKHFKTNYETELITEGEIKTDNKPVEFSYTPDEYGETLIEVQYKNGHKASYFFRIQSLVDSRKRNDSEVLSLATNKKDYKVGEKARLIIKTPYKGKALISIENKDKVLKSYWIDLKKTKTIEEIEITKDMSYTTYFYVTVIQPHGQTVNDRSLRLYGATPIFVEDKNTILDLDVKTPEKIMPGQKFSIEINEKNHKEFQYTIAIVDEGLLNINKFKTPDPVFFFKQKEMLLVKTYDIFGNIIGANWSKIFKTFSIGGDGEVRRDAVHKRGEKVQRFKPVSLFKGPIKSDKYGYSKVEFEMPNYVGSVRVMVIATKGKGYGSIEKTVPVKSELMVLPTLPRMLAPNDVVEVPVSVFALKNGLGKTKVSMKIDGEVEIIGNNTKTINFDKPDEKEVYFKFKVKNSVGKVKVEFLAQSNNYVATKNIDMEIVSPLDYKYSKNKYKLKKDEKIKVKLKGDGIKGSNLIKLTVSTKPNIEFNQRLNYLIKYPYGCIEQTTSAIFPQVYLKYLFDTTKYREKQIDENINNGIKRLRKFQTNKGGFSYWPYSKTEDGWGTNYAGHFMIEARNAGYYVPNDMFNKWLNYEMNVARNGKGNILERAYRLYLLALAGKPNIGEMNVLKQNHFKNMNDLGKWYLAAAYKMAGSDQTAYEIIDDAGVFVNNYRETGGTYGSSLRDKAAILETMVYLDEENKSFFLYKDILDQIISNRWMSTQETAYSMVAIAKYLKGSAGSNNDILLEMQTGNKEKQYLKTDKLSYSFLINKDFGKDITLINRSEKPLNISLEWEGIPKESQNKPISNKIDVDVEWLTKEGKKVDPTILKQGDVIWGHFRVKKKVNQSIENMALKQLVPSGWEIGNMRILGEKLPEWVQNYYLNHEEYLDIRDNKIMWFFDFNKYDEYYDFVVKINIVSIGEFYLPAAKFEAMYDNSYLSNNSGKRVQVVK